MLLGSGSRRLAHVGSADRELDYYRSLSRYFDVWLFEYDAPAEGWPSGNIHSLKRRFRNAWLQSTLGALARGGAPRPSVIRTKQFWGSWSGILLKVATRRPLVIRMGYHWSHNVMVERDIRHPFLQVLLRRFERLLVRQADALIFGSQTIADAFADIRRPGLVVPNGINPNTFFPGHDAHSYDAIYVGRLIPVKGFDRLVQAVPASLRLCVIGTGPLSALLVGRTNTDWIDQVPNNALGSHFRSARCFISLSRTEGSPKALFEALCCGCYPILSDIPPHRAIVEEVGYGTLVPDDVSPADIMAAVAGADVPPAKRDVFREAYRMDRLVDIEAAFLARVGADV